MSQLLVIRRLMVTPLKENLSINGYLVKKIENKTIYFFMLCVTYAFVFIVKNMNILSNGTYERKYLQREYNEMLFYLLKYYILNNLYNKFIIFYPYSVLWLFFI